MMWSLSRQGANHLELVLPVPGHVGGVYAVGRKGDIVLRADADKVSLQHARLELRAGSLLICDVGSRSGSFVNGERLEPTHERSLIPGDRVRLGTVDFLVGRSPEMVFFYVVPTPPPAHTTVPWKPAQAQQQRVRRMCDTLGAQLVDAWSADVTHLLCDSLAPTAEVLLALAESIPLVRPEFVKRAAARRSAAEPMPSPYDKSLHPLPPPSAPGMGAAAEGDPTPRPERRELLLGMRLVVVPGHAAAGPAREDGADLTASLITSMGGEVLPWPAATSSDEVAPFLKSELQRGTIFVIPEHGPSAPASFVAEMWLRILRAEGAGLASTWDVHRCLLECTSRHLTDHNELRSQTRSSPRPSPLRSPQTPTATATRASSPRVSAGR